MLRRLPKPYSREELSALACSNSRPEILAVMTLLGETGLRSAEALSVTRDVAETWPSPGKIRNRHPRAMLRVVGKGAGSMHTEDGGKERVVPLSREALLAARTLLAHPSTNGRAEYLVPWSERGLRYVIAEAGKRAGVHAHPHRFRHTAATEMIEAGVDPLVVADVLGHESLDTTRIYTLLSVRRKHEAVRARRRWRRNL